MPANDEKVEDLEGQDIAVKDEEQPEVPIPSDSSTLKTGVLTMLGDASRASVSSVYGFLAADAESHQDTLPAQESMLDFIYDELDELDSQRLSKLYTILSRFE